MAHYLALCYQLYLKDVKSKVILRNRIKLDHIDCEICSKKN